MNANTHQHDENPADGRYDSNVGLGIELKRIDPRPDIDPLTGAPWAFPYSRMEMTEDEFFRAYGYMPNEHS